jgi:hypothetical protein
MYRFIIPFSDGKVWDLAIGANSLAEAVDQYQRYYWNPCTPGAIAVFFNHCLEGRILPILDQQSGENVPLFQPWP